MCTLTMASFALLYVALKGLSGGKSRLCFPFFFHICFDNGATLCSSEWSSNGALTPVGRLYTDNLTACIACVSECVYAKETFAFFYYCYYRQYGKRKRDAWLTHIQICPLRVFSGSIVHIVIRKWPTSCRLH